MRTAHLPTVSHGSLSEGGGLPTPQKGPGTRDTHPSKEDGTRDTYPL